MWLGIVLICAVALLPALVCLRRAPRPRSERESALALYRGQLAELDRDHAGDLIGAAEYDAARLEIQRRLLAADRLQNAEIVPPRHSRVGWILAVIPVLAFALYLTNGHPSLPAQPLSLRHTPQDAKSDALIAELRNGLSGLAPTDPRYAQGYLLLGQAEASRQHYAAAARAWHRVLDQKFDPLLALQTAEAQTLAEGHVSADSLALYKQAIPAIPQDASYRMSIEARIAEGEHDASATR